MLSITCKLWYVTYLEDMMFSSIVNNDVLFFRPWKRTSYTYYKVLRTTDRHLDRGITILLRYQSGDVANVSMSPISSQACTMSTGQIRLVTHTTIGYAVTYDSFFSSNQIRNVGDLKYF